MSLDDDVRKEETQKTIEYITTYPCKHQGHQKTNLCSIEGYEDCTHCNYDGTEKERNCRGYNPIELLKPINKNTDE